MEIEFERAVGTCMVTPVATVQDVEPLAAAAKKLTDLGVSALPVVDRSGRLVGVIGWENLFKVGTFRPQRAEAKRHLWLPELRVSEAMDGRIPVVRRHSTLAACARQMVDQRIHRVYVVEDGPLEGVLSTTELLSAIERARIETPVADIRLSAFTTLERSAPLSAASAGLGEDSALVVVHEGTPVGILSQLQARRAREANPDEAVSLWMDPSVIALPADMPLGQAAARTRSERARYCVVSDGARLSGWLTRLEFAGVVQNS